MNEIILSNYKSDLLNFVNSEDFATVSNDKLGIALNSFNSSFKEAYPDFDTEDQSEMNKIGEQVLTNWKNAAEIPRFIPKAEEFDLYYGSQAPDFSGAKNAEEKVAAAKKWEEESYKRASDLVPALSEDFKTHLEYMTNNNIRQVVSDENKTGWLSDKAYRAVEGGLSMAAPFVPGADRFLAETFPENTEMDDDISSLLFAGAGQLASQAAIALGSSALAGPEAGVAAIGTIYSARALVEGYKEEMRKSGNPSKALEVGLAGVPGAQLEVFADSFLLGLGGSGKVALKAFKEATTDAARVAILKEAIPSLTGKALKAGLAEASVGSVGADLTTGYGRYLASGDESYIPTGEQLAKGALVEGLLGAGYTTAFNRPTADMSQLSKDLKTFSQDKANSNEIFNALKSKNYDLAVELATKEYANKPEKKQEANKIITDGLAKPSEESKNKALSPILPSHRAVLKLKLKELQSKTDQDSIASAERISKALKEIESGSFTSPDSISLDLIAPEFQPTNTPVSVNDGNVTTLKNGSEVNSDESVIYINGISESAVVTQSISNGGLGIYLDSKSGSAGFAFPNKTKSGKFKWSQSPKVGYTAVKTNGVHADNNGNFIVSNFTILGEVSGAKKSEQANQKTKTVSDKYKNKNKETDYTESGIDDAILILDSLNATETLSKEGYQSVEDTILTALQKLEQYANNNPSEASGIEDIKNELWNSIPQFQAKVRDVAVNQAAPVRADMTIFREKINEQTEANPSATEQDPLTIAKSQPVGTQFTDSRGGIWEKSQDGWTLTSTEFNDSKGVAATRPFTDESAILSIRNQLLAAPPIILAPAYNTNTTVENKQPQEITNPVQVKDLVGKKVSFQGVTGNLTIDGTEAYVNDVKVSGSEALISDVEGLSEVSPRNTEYTLGPDADGRMYKREADESGFYKVYEDGSRVKLLGRKGGQVMADNKNTNAPKANVQKATAQNTVENTSDQTNQENPYTNPSGVANFIENNSKGLPDGYSISPEISQYGEFSGKLNIVFNGENVGYITIDYDYAANEVRINKSEISKDHRGLGLAKNTYITINEALTSNGLPPLKSDNRSLTKDAARVWKSLEKAGLVEQRNDDQIGFEFKLNPPTPPTVETIVNTPDAVFETVETVENTETPVNVEHTVENEQPPAENSSSEEELLIKIQKEKDSLNNVSERWHAKIKTRIADLEAQLALLKSTGAKDVPTAVEQIKQEIIADREEAESQEEVVDEEEDDPEFDKNQDKYNEEIIQDLTKSQALKLVKKYHRLGYISDSDLAEAEMAAKDKDYTADDVFSSVQFQRRPKLGIKKGQVAVLDVEIKNPARGDENGYYVFTAGGKSYSVKLNKSGPLKGWQFVDPKTGNVSAVIGKNKEEARATLANFINENVDINEVFIVNEESNSEILKKVLWTQSRKENQKEDKKRLNDIAEAKTNKSINDKIDEFISEIKQPARKAIWENNRTAIFDYIKNTISLTPEALDTFINTLKAAGVKSTKSIIEESDNIASAISEKAKDKIQKERDETKSGMSKSEKDFLEKTKKEDENAKDVAKKLGIRYSIASNPNENSIDEETASKYIKDNNLNVTIENTKKTTEDGHQWNGRTDFRSGVPQISVNIANISSLEQLRNVINEELSHVAYNDKNISSMLGKIKDSTKLRQELGDLYSEQEIEEESVVKRMADLVDNYSEKGMFGKLFTAIKSYVKESFGMELNDVDLSYIAYRAIVKANKVISSNGNKSFSRQNNNLAVKNQYTNFFDTVNLELISKDNSNISDEDVSRYINSRLDQYARNKNINTFSQGTADMIKFYEEANNGDKSKIEKVRTHIRETANAILEARNRIKEIENESKIATRRSFIALSGLSILGLGTFGFASNQYKESVKEKNRKLFLEFKESLVFDKNTSDLINNTSNNIKEEGDKRISVNIEIKANEESIEDLGIEKLDPTIVSNSVDENGNNISFSRVDYVSKINEIIEKRLKLIENKDAVDLAISKIVRVAEQLTGVTLTEDVKISLKNLESDAISSSVKKARGKKGKNIYSAYVEADGYITMNTEAIYDIAFGNIEDKINAASTLFNEITHVMQLNKNTGKFKELGFNPKLPYPIEASFKSWLDDLYGPQMDNIEYESFVLSYMGTKVFEQINNVKRTELSDEYIKSKAEEKSKGFVKIEHGRDLIVINNPIRYSKVDPTASNKNTNNQQSAQQASNQATNGYTEVPDLFSELTNTITTEQKNTFKKVQKMLRKKLEKKLIVDEPSAWSLLKSVKFKFLKDEDLRSYNSLLDEFVRTRSKNKDPKSDVRDSAETVIAKASDLAKKANQGHFEFLQTKHEFLEDKDFMKDYQGDIDLVMQLAKDDRGMNDSDLPSEKEAESMQNWQLRVIELQELIFENMDYVNDRLEEMFPSSNIITSNPILSKYTNVLEGNVNDIIETQKSIFKSRMNQLMGDPTEKSYRDLRKQYFGLMDFLSDGYALNIEDFVSQETIDILNTNISDKDIIDMHKAPWRKKFLTGASSFYANTRMLGTKVADVTNKLTNRFRSGIMAAERVHDEFTKPALKEMYENAVAENGGKEFNGQELNNAGIYAYSRAFKSTEGVTEGILNSRRSVESSIKKDIESVYAPRRKAAQEHLQFLNDLFVGITEQTPNEEAMGILEANAERIMPKGLMNYVKGINDLFEITRPLAKFTSEFGLGKPFEHWVNYVPSLAITKEGQPIDFDLTDMSANVSSDESVNGDFNKDTNMQRNGGGSLRDRTRKLGKGMVYVFNINHLAENRMRLNLIDYLTLQQRRELNNVISGRGTVHKQFAELLKDESGSKDRVSHIQQTVRTMWSNTIQSASFISEFQAGINVFSNMWASGKLASLYQLPGQFASNLAPYFIVNSGNPKRIGYLFEAMNILLKKQMGQTLEPRLDKVVSRVLSTVKGRSQEQFLDKSIALDVNRSDLWQQIKTSPFWKNVKAIDKVREKLLFSQFIVSDLITGAPMILANMMANEEAAGRATSFDGLTFNDESFIKSVDEAERFIGIGASSRRGVWTNNKNGYLVALRNMLSAFSSHRINNATNFAIELSRITNTNTSSEEKVQSAKYMIGIQAQSAVFSVIKWGMIGFFYNALTSAMGDDENEKELEKEYKKLLANENISKQQKEMIKAEISLRENLMNEYKKAKDKNNSYEVLMVRGLQDMVANSFLIPAVTDVPVNAVIHNTYDKLSAENFNNIKESELSDLNVKLKKAKDRGDITSAVALQKEISQWESQEAVAFVYEGQSLIPFDGVYGGVMKDAAKFIDTASSSVIKGEAMSLADVFLGTGIVGLSQPDLNRIARMYSKKAEYEAEYKEKIDAIKSKKKN